MIEIFLMQGMKSWGFGKTCGARELWNDCIYLRRCLAIFFTIVI